MAFEAAIDVRFGRAYGIACVFDRVSVSCNGARRRFCVAVRNTQLDVCARCVFVIDVEARYVRTVGAAGNCGVYDVKIEHLGIAVFDGAAQLRGTKIVLGAAQYQGRGVFGVGKQALSFCLYVIFCGQYLLDLDNSN